MSDTHTRPNAGSVPARADSRLAGEIKTLLTDGDHDGARERFEVLVERHQRRATRIAYYYLRDPAEVDEVVQDAFLKTFVHLPSFREELLFELWFTRIVINGCLDRLKTRARRARWLQLAADNDGALAMRRAAPGPSPEGTLLARERRTRVADAIKRLPNRQRTVLLLGQFEGYSTREVAEILELSEATVRVHLFRAVRSLRKRLQREHWLLNSIPREREAI